MSGSIRWCMTGIRYACILVVFLMHYDVNDHLYHTVYIRECPCKPRSLQIKGFTEIQEGNKKRRYSNQTQDPGFQILLSKMANKRSFGTLAEDGYQSDCER